MSIIHQYFSLVTNQQTVLLAITFQPKHSSEFDGEKVPNPATLGVLYA
jgi:hypothetical protein